MKLTLEEQQINPANVQTDEEHAFVDLAKLGIVSTYSAWCLERG